MVINAHILISCFLSRNTDNSKKRNHTAMDRAAEISNLTPLEANAVPPVLWKKQYVGGENGEGKEGAIFQMPISRFLRLKESRKKVREEGYIPANVELERVLTIEQAEVRDNPKVPPTPALVFRQLFSRVVLDEWRERTNIQLAEQGIYAMSRGEMYSYLGTVIKMCLTPLDAQRDHWQVKKKKKIQKVNIFSK
jgi:hypothetical protein